MPPRPVRPTIPRETRVKQVKGLTPTLSNELPRAAGTSRPYATTMAAVPAHMNARPDR